MAKEERARYDAAKVRRRAEEALGWKAGSSGTMPFLTLLEALKAKPEKWKVRRDIEDMLRTGDHLLAPMAERAYDNLMREAERRTR